jgi:uncharacterized protein (TIGR02646 family)
MTSNAWQDKRPELAPQVLQKTRGRCAYCGCKLSATRFDIEHVVPQSRGSSDDLTNLVPACRGCNLQKRTLSLNEYKDYIPRSIIEDLISAVNRMRHHRNLVDASLLVPQAKAVTRAIEALKGMQVTFAFEDLLYETEKEFTDE